MRNWINIMETTAGVQTLADMVRFPDYGPEVADHVIEFATKLLGLGYKEAIGRTRVAMIAPDMRTVIKIPLIDEGMRDNNREQQAFRMHQRGTGLVPMAACRVFFADEAIGIPMLMMRYVKALPSYLKDAPFWVGFVDGQQVGHDHKGNLVAYDL